ncbi:MAG: hypothetical protein HYZ28_12650 [Myxococcales bacterium]|nr:hypothetical protein [Myxococcales bacterium]
MKRWFSDASAVLGRSAAMACAAAFAVVAVAFAWSALQGAPAEHAAAGGHGESVMDAGAFGPLIASWLFFTGTAFGVLGFQAAMRIAGAQWSRSLLPLFPAAYGFVPFGALVLALLLLGVSRWAPWVHDSMPHREWWLNVPFLVVRSVVLYSALAWLGWLLVKPRKDGAEPSMRVAVVYCLVYAVTLSVWWFDFVLALDPEWVSTLLGAQGFMGALLAGVAVVALLALKTGMASGDQRHDLGKLLFGFSVFWAYLVWSQYLPIWFGNMPEETGFLLRRMHSPWLPLTVLVVGLSFVVPFIGLFSEKAKRAPRVLAALAIGLLAGQWLEKYLMVVPSVSGEHSAVGIAAVLVSLGLAGAFVLLVAGALRPAPVPAVS